MDTYRFIELRAPGRADSLFGKTVCRYARLLPRRRTGVYDIVGWLGLPVVGGAGGQVVAGHPGTGTASRRRACLEMMAHPAGGRVDGEYSVLSLGRRFAAGPNCVPRELQRVGGTVRLRIRSNSVRSADCSVADIAPAELVNSGAYPRLVLEVVFVTLGALMKTVPFRDLGEAVKFIAALEITSLC
jgi:hypothetical protein